MGRPNLDHKKPYPETIRQYLARAGMNRDRVSWDEDVQAWRMSVNFLRDLSEEQFIEWVRKLPLVVPGLSVVKKLCEEASWPTKMNMFVWFTWSEDAMWARLQEVFQEYGVTDERLAYKKCEGKLQPLDGQQRLPGIVEVEPRGRIGQIGGRGFFSSWTAWGLQIIESAFCHRIMYPDRGGPEVAHYNEQCIVGNHWWLVGTKGDSEEIMTLEILASPLSEEVKENLILNLKEFRASKDPELQPAV